MKVIESKPLIGRQVRAIVVLILKSEKYINKRGIGKNRIQALSKKGLIDIDFDGSPRTEVNVGKLYKLHYFSEDITYKDAKEQIKTFTVFSIVHIDEGDANRNDFFEDEEEKVLGKNVIACAPLPLLKTEMVNATIFDITEFKTKEGIEMRKVSAVLSDGDEVEILCSNELVTHKFEVGKKYNLSVVFANIFIKGKNYNTYDFDAVLLQTF